MKETPLNICFLSSPAKSVHYISKTFLEIKILPSKFLGMCHIFQSKENLAQDNMGKAVGIDILAPFPNSLRLPPFYMMFGA